MDGIILINKEKEISSFGVVHSVKRILNIKKVGHAGTLDPNATGLLPILVGNGTKISKYLIEHNKTYIATLQLGEKRDTADSEGKIIETKEVDFQEINEEKIKATLKTFIGKQEQTPPIYSAIKVNGKKLYEYARNNEEVVIQKRKIEIYNIELEKIDREACSVCFKADCSKGTYIRTLCEDIACRLGTVGYMKELERTRINDFQIEEAITLKELEENNNEFLNKNIISIEEIFANKAKIKLDEKLLTLFLNGVKLQKDLTNDIYRIYDTNDKFIGIGVIEAGKLKRDVIC